jgi:hypothetical protein
MNVVRPSLYFSASPFTRADGVKMQLLMLNANGNAELGDFQFQLSPKDFEWVENKKTYTNDGSNEVTVYRFGVSAYNRLILV